jgi:type III secretory pathway component EscT
MLAAMVLAEVLLLLLNRRAEGIAQGQLWFEAVRGAS